ncbi:hypothetical protein DBR06_SOUSAS12410026, partial [Sousa chinensis]
VADESQPEQQSSGDNICEPVGELMCREESCGVILVVIICFFIQLARDLLHPSLEEEKKKHKKKRLVQSPNSYFMDVKCPGCYKITTVFSHAQTVVLCVGCSTVLCQPTGGKARLTEDLTEINTIFKCSIALKNVLARLPKPLYHAMILELCVHGVHLEESNTNDPHNFLNLCSITESLISSVIPVNLPR